MDLASQRIRDKLRSGILPNSEPIKTWAGYGNGTTCDGCDMRIEPREAEHEVELESGRTLHFHVACASLWLAYRSTA
jgi:methionyl-tRNA synthetase